MEPEGNGGDKATIRTPIVTFDVAGKHTTIILVFVVMTVLLASVFYYGFERMGLKIDALGDAQDFNTCIIMLSLEYPRGGSPPGAFTEAELKRHCWWLKKGTP